MPILFLSFSFHASQTCIIDGITTTESGALFILSWLWFPITSCSLLWQTRNFQILHESTTENETPSGNTGNSWNRDTGEFYFTLHVFNAWQLNYESETWEEWFLKQSLCLIFILNFLRKLKVNHKWISWETTDVFGFILFIKYFFIEKEIWFPTVFSSVLSRDTLFN